MTGTELSDRLAIYRFLSDDIAQKSLSISSTKSVIYNICYNDVTKAVTCGDISVNLIMIKIAGVPYSMGDLH